MFVELSINFLVGLVSFLSPCVLPLVPAYISYMGGRMTYSVSAQVDIVAEAGGTAKLRRTTAMRLSTFLHGLAFVAGFTFVFVVLTILATAFIQQIGSTRVVEGIIGRVGGLIIIFLGFHFMGALPALFNQLRKRDFILKNPLFSVIIGLFFTILIVWGFTGAVIPFGDDRIPLWSIALSAVLLAILWTFFMISGAFTQPASFWNKAMNTVELALYADTRRQMAAAGTSGLAGSALLGVVFAAGWSPCIGPTLGAAMGIAAQQDISTAVILIMAYCLGLGIPFLITALMLDSAQGILRRLNKHMNKIKIISGVFLVAIGILVASGQLQQLSASFSNQTGSFSYVFDECANGIVEETIDSSELNACIASGNYSAYIACVDGIDAQKITSEQYNACISSVNSINFVACQNGLSQEIISAEQLDECITSNNFNVYVDCSIALEKGDITINQFNECIRNFSYNRFLDTLSPEAESTPEASLPVGAGSILDTANQIGDIGLGIGQTAPDFSTTTPSGEVIRLNDLRGKTVLLNFWFVACPPCRSEMPAFQNVYESVTDDSFIVLAVNSTDDNGAMVAFADEFGLTFPLLTDSSGAILDRYNITGFPTTYLIDENGVIIQSQLGPLSEEKLAEWITKLAS